MVRGIDADTRSYRYYRNAVERHWDPAGIDLATDRDRVPELNEVGFVQLRRLLALFGAGETAVTEDLAPLPVVVEDVDDQLFLATQLYEEAKHADFFDRYWTEVIRPTEDELGLERTEPTDARWFSDPYEELFERNRVATHRLLEEDTPENRARAYCHYHLTIEGILAQTGYFAAQRSFSGEAEAPELPGLVEGFRKIRGDEGRHVGFGMTKLKALVETGDVEAALLHETVGELVGLVQASLEAARPEDVTEAPAPGLDLVTYAAEKHAERMEQITDATADVPDLETLTHVED